LKSINKYHITVFSVNNLPNVTARSLNCKSNARPQDFTHEQFAQGLK